MEDYKRSNLVHALIPIVVLGGLIAVIKVFHGILYVNAAGIGLTLGGLLFSYIAVAFWNIGDKKTAEYSRQCIGHVTGYSESRDPEEGTYSYSIDVAYMVDGEEYSMGSGYSYGSKKNLPPIGDPVTIFYHPSNPRFMQTEYDIKSNRKFVLWFMVGGMSLLVAGVALCSIFSQLFSF